MLCPSKSKGEVPGLSASEQRTFLQSLWEHLRGNGMVQPTTQCAVAEVEGKVVSAARLYRAVGLRGGFDNVSKRDWWRSIGQEFGTSVAADGVWRSKYELLLKGYEDKYLDASKYCSKADAVVSSVDRQPPLQQSFLSLQPQQARPSTPVAPLRSAQPVWPVPAPRPASGIKRSASGEAASASAKKQKTTPLATYQQAQEHLRVQMARQGAQHGESRKVAEDMLSSIAPSLGPLLTVPSDFASSHAKEIQLALRSRVHSSVAWSLNALTVLSFNANPPLLLTQHPGVLDALLQVITSGLKEETTSAGDCDECITPAKQLLPRRQPQPKPGEPQGWWWEKEEGVLAPQPGAGWAFTHACCACNVLRNLAMESSNHAALIGQDTVAALVQCLEARREQPCPDTNDLALNALDCLHKVAPRLQLRLAQETQNLGSLAEAAEDGSLGMLEHLSALLRVDIIQAQQQIHQELAGSLGRPDMYADSLSQKDRSAMALNLQAQTLADAAKAVSELVRYQSLRLKQAVASNSRLMYSTAVLINVSELPDAQDKLRVYEMRIAELAMTDSPQKEWVATLLSRIGPAPD
ncbi:hypothetical protein WJX82_003707 [Trebouxia sp. C0006]